MRGHSIIFVFLVISGVLTPAWATVDFNSYLPMTGTLAMPQFKFTKIVTIDYPDGGKLRNIFNGRTVNVSFSDSSDKNPDIKYLMNQINTNLQTGANSNAQITNLNVDYNVSITGNQNQVVLNYYLMLTPTLTNYVLNKGNDDVPTVFDLSWIGFTVKNPVTIATKQYGNLEINSLIGVIQNQFPDAYYILQGTAAENSLNLNLIDSSPLVAYPIDRWNTLFDPTYTPSETTGYGYGGQKIAVTGFAYGQSDLYQGSLKTQNHELDFTVDAKYHLSVIDRASSGTIDVDGHANGYLIDGYPVISTSPPRTHYTGCVGCNPPDQTQFWSILMIVIVGIAVILFCIFYFRRFKED